MARAAPGSSNIAPALLSSASELALAEYQWFHRHPEVANEEQQTAARLADSLQSFGFEVHRGVGGHGLLAILQGQKSSTGPTVLYRADMDGLLVTERTNLAHGSENPGVMHACGHDIHMATAVGALRHGVTGRGRSFSWGSPLARSCLSPTTCSCGCALPCLRRGST